MGNNDAARMGSNLSLPIEDAQGEGVSELIAKLAELDQEYAIVYLVGGPGEYSGKEFLHWFEGREPSKRLKMPYMERRAAVSGVPPPMTFGSLTYRLAREVGGCLIYLFEGEK